MNTPDLLHWNPENRSRADRRLAWTTVWISTVSLTLGFCAWFLVSALAPRLNAVGFHLSHTQLYWLVAMVGLSAGSMRIVWTFLPPLLGTRVLVTFSTAILLVPLLGWIYAVQRPSTPYAWLLILALLSGIGGGSFSGLMASSSYFFPKAEKGTALAVQGGLSDFGTSLVQFVTPWIIGFALFGFLGTPQSASGKLGQDSHLWLQNAAAIYVPIVILVTVMAWLLLRSVPIRASLATQSAIFRNKHTWIMTLFYYATFSTFAGLGAQMGLLGHETFNQISGAPNAVAYAFLGPLVGSISRVIAGPFADRFRGGRVTAVMGAATIAGLGFLVFFEPQTRADFWWWLGAMLWVFFWTGVGNASTTDQMGKLFAPMEAGGVVGWTSAIGAYGPFSFGLLLAVFSPRIMFGVNIAIFAALLALNWYFYDRRQAPNRC